MTQDFADTQSRLMLLGLSAETLSKKPDVTSYPPKFSTRCMYVWVKLFDNPKVLTLISSKNSEQAWELVFKLFMSYCRREGLTPFIGTTPADKIDFMAADLRHLRNCVVRYCYRSKFFEKKRIVLRVNNTSTKVILKDGMLRIFVRARVWRNNDPNLMQFLKGLPYPRLYLGANRIFYKDLEEHKIRFWVQYLNNLRIFMGYDIRIPWPLDSAIPNNHMATVNEIERWVRDYIWHPLVSVRRIRGTRFERF